MKGLSMMQATAQIVRKYVYYYGHLTGCHMFLVLLIISGSGQCSEHQNHQIQFPFSLNHAALLIGERANVKTSTREKNKLAKENIGLGDMTGMDTKSEMRT